MLRNDSSPSYEQLFGELDFRAEDDGRSVCSPAAYLVELLGMLEASFDGPSLLERRPDLRQIVLDAEHTFTEAPYLDIANEVLERLVGDDPYGSLRKRVHPFGLPFALRNERLKKYLAGLEVTPEELYRLFASSVDHDVVAREYLGLSAEDVAVVTTVLPEAALRTAYGFGDKDTFAGLQEARRFSEATGLSGDQVRELVAISPGVVMAADNTRIEPAARPGAVEVAWFERAGRVARLARLTGLSLTDLGTILTSCCDGTLDAAALRSVAIVIRLGRRHDLTPAQVCELAGAAGPAVIEGCTGDILAPRNRDYRARLAVAINVAESDIATVVRRYREHYDAPSPSPFDRGDIGQAEIALLRRVVRLAGTLGVAVDELFDVLIALGRDPSLYRWSTFVTLDPPGAGDPYEVLAGDDGGAALRLIQLMLAVVAWMRDTGFGAAELTAILGGRPENDADPDAIRRALGPVAFTPAVLASDRFSERAARVIHDALATHETPAARLPRLDPAVVPGAAAAAVDQLGVITAADFTGLGLDRRLTAKIFANLVHLGVLSAEGALLAEAPGDLRLARDYSSYQEMLFKMIGAAANGTTSFFPSDLVMLDHLTPDQQAELYDNLTFNGYVNPDGDLRDPAFFADAANAALFDVDVDLSDVTGAVRQLIDDRVATFRSAPLALDPAVFTDLRATPAQLTSLTASLRFNGFLDDAGCYSAKAALSDLDPADFRLAPPFHRHRRVILDAMRAQIAAFQAEVQTFTADDFAPLADAAMGERVRAALEGTHTAGGRVLDESLFADPFGTLDLGPGFTAAELRVVHRRISQALADQEPYRLQAASLAGLGFTDDECDRLAAQLTEMGLLTAGRGLTPDWLPWFRAESNALDFVLEDLEDYQTEIFFLLHAVAIEQHAAVIEIGDSLAAHAGRQQDTLYGALADSFGVPVATVAAICEAVTGSADAALDVFTTVPAGARFRLAHRRVRRFALLAAKLGLDPAEIAAVFKDQDLVGKFGENLALPPGVTRFDALLESSDGTVYAFGEGGYWTWSAATYELTSPAPRPLTDLSGRFGALVAVDAAFRHPSGTEWLIGRDGQGATHAFTRDEGSARWVPRDQVWGRIRNTFEDPARVDAAFVDPNGRTFLLCGDQYVRYSRTDLRVVDEGYPRSTADWWRREELDGPMPPAFRTAIDACLRDRDGQPEAAAWGKVRNNLELAGRIDAAAEDGPVVRFFAGDQQFAYSDCVENQGVRADEGHPRRIADVPAGFDGGLDAAFTDPSGVRHLFKDGRTVSIGAGAATAGASSEPPGAVRAAAVAVADRTVQHLCAAGAAGELWHAVRSADGSWGPFGDVEGQTGDIGDVTDVSVAAIDRDLHVVVVNAAGRLWHTVRSADGRWGPFADIESQTGDIGTLRGVGIAAVGGDLHVAAVNAAGRLWHTVKYADGRWGPFGDIESQTGDMGDVADVSVAAIGPDLHVVVVNAAGRLWHTIRYGAGRWSQFGDVESQIGDIGHLRGVSVAAVGLDLHVAAVNAAGRLWHTVRLGAGRWSPFGDIESQAGDMGDVTGVSIGFAGPDLRVAAVNATGRLWRTVRYSDGHWEPAATGSRTDGVVTATAERWGVLRPALPSGTVDAAFVGLDGKTYLFSGDTYLRYSGTDYTVVDSGYPRLISRDWGGLTSVDASLVLDGSAYLFGTGGDGARFYVRYSTRDYAAPDAGFPKPLTDNWWNLLDGADFGPIDTVFTGRDDRTYLFSAGRFVTFDAQHRWWSEPRLLSVDWDSFPFKHVDAGFVGQDGRTYLFHGDQYVRYSGSDYTEVDDGYPRTVGTFWGNVVNNIARTGRVDAALVTDVTETVDGVAVPRGYTYLFSGDQYVRYVSGEYTTVQDGYPRAVAQLASEPGLAALDVTLDGVDAAYADRRTAYLFRGDTGHVVSASAYRHYTDIACLPGMTCAFIEDGSVLVQKPEGWMRRSSLEGRAVSATPFRPRTLRTVPAAFRTGLDAVLTGVDGNTYLFKGASCFNVRLNREYPLAEEWGRPRNTIFESGAVDAALPGRDGRTYLFSGDQFVVYPDAAGTTVDGDPMPISEHWAGLTSVALAYVQDGTTYLFEKPDEDGRMRCLAYSGTTYDRPDEGYPATVSAVDDGAGGDFGLPDAVLFSDDAMLLLKGRRCVSYNEKTGRWSHPRPIDRVWHGFDRLADALEEELRAAFTTAGGVTWFFFEKHYAGYTGGAFSEPAVIRERWGLSRNPFVPADGSGTVDAAFVWRGEQTFLFSGDHYVRYTGPEYRYIDPGYPRAIANNLRAEEPFTNLPESFEDFLGAPGERSGIDAIVANDRTAYIFIGGGCHVVSRTISGSIGVGALGRIRNTLAETGRVDAALVAGRSTYLFSGDQYVRYSGHDHSIVDDGYPKSIGAAFPGELDPGLAPLPDEFADGLDAAFRLPDGRVHLFKGREFLHDGRRQPIKGTWGVVGNAFTTGLPGLDAAFVAPGGDLYAFRSGQYVRYTAGRLDVADEGFPRTVTDDWGDLPGAFEQGPDGAFTFEGRTYLVKGDRYARYSSGFDRMDRTFPQEFAHRWASAADYRLSDVHTIVRFAELARSVPDGLAAFLVDGAEDPYAFLAGLFGWDADDLRWARRHSALLTPDTAEEARFEIEFLLALVDAFALTRRLGASLAEVHDEVWTLLHDDNTTPDVGAAADAVYRMLERRTGPGGWATVSARIHDELNLLKRDALVATVIADHPEFRTSREVFEQLLIDVDMGSAGTTSRVREAIAATQLFLHRYLLDLEAVRLPEGADPDEVRQRLKRWWSWMRNYRVWEANRKVFLYPENYVRPDLRSHRTPAFATLESDLLQGEITEDAVRQAYLRYLDEYTEVSRLAIAGGYVYTPDGVPDGTRRLVIFGRTRTEPRRYYYRSAEFRDGEKLSASWDPWLKVDVQIDAERVDPVHAFGRVFVFWPVVETVQPDDPSSTTIVATTDGAEQQVTAPPPMYRVRIYYSFRNLNQDWVPAQVLAVDTAQAGPISGVSLYVQASRTVPGGPAGSHDAIVVSCSYTTLGITGARAVSSAFTLTPELYGLRADKPVTPPRAADVSRVFAEPVTSRPGPASVVRFNAPADSPDGPWISVDHKGGSFLCRPITAHAEPQPMRDLQGNGELLPYSWDWIDAAFQTADGTRYFFDNSRARFLKTPKDEPSAGRNTALTTPVWGTIGANLTRGVPVDAAMVRDGRLFVFAGDEYYRYSAEIGRLDRDYPQRIDANTDRLPLWTRIDSAFAGPDGTEYFYSKTQNAFVTSADLTRPRRLSELWPEASGRVLDTVAVAAGKTYLVFGNEYLPVVPDNRVPQLRPFTGNADSLPPSAPSGPSVFWGGNLLRFDNAQQMWELAGPTVTAARTGRLTDLSPVESLLGREGRVDAAYLAEVDGATKLYLVSRDQFVRYSVDGSTIAGLTDPGYPKRTSREVNAVFRRLGQRYAVSGGMYAPLPDDVELDATLTWAPIADNWRGLPTGLSGRFTVLDTDEKLFLFRGKQYAAYTNKGITPSPYEIAGLPTDIVRLTSSTAFELNRRLLAGGVDALLSPETQEIDELPAFSTTRSDATTIQVPDRVLTARMPTSSHLDFTSSNGTYYWEIFFHAPLLIAQVLNSAQRFEEARRWFEYIFDPTERTHYWRFLPFLAVDVDALVVSCRGDLATPDGARARAAFEPVLQRLSGLAPAFHQIRDLTADDIAYLDTLAGDGLDDVVTALKSVPAGAVRRSLEERVAMIARLGRQYDAIGDRGSLIKAYLDDPFDPHAIAELRPVAYRRSVVMAYIDNVLDGADMLFRQYTAESVDEARMLYILAYDLLGQRPYDLGARALPPAAAYAALEAAPAGPEVEHLTAGGTLLEGAGSVHAGVANPYFYVPANSTFFEYWTRVEDRLRKIRQSMDILGISRPLPMFEPPADVMALVRGAATGAALDQVTAAAAAPVPNHRFAVLIRRAQDLADRVRQFGGDLLSTMERRDAEELFLLQQRQEAAVLALTRGIKEAELRIAVERLAETRAALDGAAARVVHYETQIATGLTAVQQAQIELMSHGANAHFAAAGLKIGAAIAKGMPEMLIGPFIMGFQQGGDEFGGALETGSDISSSLGEGLALAGEILGIRAEQERTAQDWNLQLGISRSDVVQIGHQVTAAEHQVAIAQRELDTLNLQAANNEAVLTYVTGKFAGPQLYHWMAGRLSAMYLQTYHLAYETARAAERAYQFETGDSGSAYVQPSSWDSRRQGLLAGESLWLDLERLNRAYSTAGRRTLEITRRVSLFALDPLALLDLRNTGRCEFAFTEALFDRDFPGHFRRQIRTVSVSFDAEDGPLGVNATLTQLDHRTVLSADPAAVKFLLEPNGSPPAAVRTDWRAGDQVVLSEVEEGRDNNGLFETRFDDDRYLPFEGTGAVSRWRLDTGGQRPPDDLLDVTVTVKYTAEAGGETFATAVRGMLKPYPATRMFNVAAEFPEAWAEFRDNGSATLVLPLAPDQFPDIVGRQITGVYAKYQLLDGGTAQFLLGGDKRLALADGKLLRTPGLTLGAGGWRLQLEGDKSALDNLGLMLTYRANR
ncbi:hemopexin repeat-containing protein [Actinoplanes sp. NPDC051861]|uniref:hemopexin repeat-containing protein n=1 Tax=Actinoplanes sp. NPDC051861 TaxID=3155170 RepID=UPI0034466060